MVPKHCPKLRRYPHWSAIIKNPPLYGGQEVRAIIIKFAALRNRRTKISIVGGVVRYNGQHPILFVLKD